MQIKTVSPEWKCCATCTYWTGYQKFDSWREKVEYDFHEKSACIRAGKSAPTDCDAGCGYWKQKFEK